MVVKDPSAAEQLLGTDATSQGREPAHTASIVAARRAVSKILAAAVDGPIGFLVRLRAQVVRQQHMYRTQAAAERVDIGEVWAPGSTEDLDPSAGNGGAPARLSKQVADLMNSATQDSAEASGASVMGRAALRAVLAACVSEWQKGRANDDGASVAPRTPARPVAVPKLDLSRLSHSPDTRTPKRTLPHREKLVFHHLGLYVCEGLPCGCAHNSRAPTGPGTLRMCRWYSTRRHAKPLISPRTIPFARPCSPNHGATGCYCLRHTVGSPTTPNLRRCKPWMRSCGESLLCCMVLTRKVAPTQVMTTRQALSPLPARLWGCRQVTWLDCQAHTI